MVKALLKVIQSMYRHFKWLILAMTITSALGTSMMIGLTSSYDSFKTSSYSYLEDYGYPDITLNIELGTEIDFTKLQSIDGVEKSSGRIVIQQGLKTENDSSLSAKFYCFSNNEIESFYYYEKDETINGVYIDNQFAKNNNIKIGDTITLNVASYIGIELPVSALVASPECLNNRQSNGSWGDNTRFGSIFIPEIIWGGYFSIFPYIPYNQIVLRSNGTASNEQILSAATKIIGEDSVESSYTFETSNAKKMIDVNLAPLKALAIFLPLCFYAGALLVLCVFLFQIIRQYKKQLGILTAIGYTKGQLVLIISLLALSITLISSILAILIGIGLGNLSFSLFLNSVHIPVGSFAITISSTLIAYLIAFAISEIAALLSTIIMLKISPSQIINQAPDPAQTNKSKTLDKILSKTSAYTKINILTIFRSRGRLLISSLCLIASIFLITASCSFHYSKEAILDQLFELRFDNDCQIGYSSFPDTLTIDEIKKIDGVTKVEVYSYYNVDISFNNKTENININGVPSNHSLLKIPDEGDGVISSVTGFVLEKHTADNLGVKVGDYVYLDGKQTLVAALSNQYVYRMSYLPISDETNHQGMVLCDLSSKTGIMSEIYATTSFYGITFTDELYESSKENFALYDIGVLICILFAVVMGLIIIFNTEQTNLLEEQRRLSILRILGVKISQISLWWLINLVIQLIIALLIGLPLGTLVAKLILLGMNTVSREYPFIGDPRLYLFTIAIILAFSIISHFVCMLWIKKWNLAENTKSKT